MDISAARPHRVEKDDAAPWTEAMLRTPQPDQLTVVYHSIFLQYLSQPMREHLFQIVQAAGVRATEPSPLAWLRYEPEAALGGPLESRRYVLDVVEWPGGARREVAEVDPHGRFVRWLANKP